MTQLAQIRQEKEDQRKLKVVADLYNEVVFLFGLALNVLEQGRTEQGKRYQQQAELVREQADVQFGHLSPRLQKRYNEMVAA